MIILLIVLVVVSTVGIMSFYEYRVMKVLPETNLIEAYITLKRIRRRK